MTRPQSLTSIAFHCFWLFPLLVGCPGCGDGDDGGNEDGTANTQRQSSLDEDECNSQLDGVFETTSPAILGLTSDRKQAVGMLNQWYHSCGESDLPESGFTLPQAVAGLLSDEAREHAEGENFSLRDGFHLRNAILYHRTCDFVTAGAESDRERVMRLFNYVVRNVFRQPTDLPFSPFHTLLIGRGTGRHQAWIFANLLRELRIDSVILQPRSADAGSDQWLVGVLLEGEVLLFDMHLGLPVPGPNSKRVFREAPATLTDALNEPELFAPLAADEGTPYRLDAESLRSLRVQLIGGSSYWAPRMHALQRHLNRREENPLVYDPLHSEEGRQGLIARVASAGKGYWTEDDVSIWPFPEENLTRYEQRREDDQTRMNATFSLLWTPQPIIGFNPRIPRLQMAVHLRQELMEARIEQLEGKLKRAVTTYVRARQWVMSPPLEFQEVSEKDREEGWISQEDILKEPGGLQSLARMVPADAQERHRRAAEMALLWTGDSQLQQEEYAAASASYREFIRRSDFGFVVVAHKENRLDALTPRQFSALFLRQVRNWADVGGETKSSVVYVAGDISRPARARFVEKIVGANLPLFQSLIENKQVLQREDAGAVIEAVTLDRGAIGLIDLKDWNPDEDRVKPLGVLVGDPPRPATVGPDGPDANYVFAVRRPTVHAARVRLALALKAEDHMEEALSVLEAVPKNSTSHATAAALRRLWSERSGSQ